MILIGAPGAGKSTAGRILARRWGVGFRDTDDDIVATAGKSVADIFVTDGEPAFREFERQAVRAAMADHHGVLALGGGAVLDPGTRELVRDQPTVWLRVRAPVATARVGLSGARPLLLGGVRSKMVALLAERDPVYQETAAAAVETDGLTPDEVADAVAAAVARLAKADAP